MLEIKNLTGGYIHVPVLKMCPLQLKVGSWLV